MRGALAWLASYRLRILFRSAFLLLALAVVAMAVTVLQGEKQLSYDNYQASFAKTKEQIVARLRHPAGQLALLNPQRGAGPVTPLRPVILPFSAIDFDDQNKVRHTVEMADCLVRYRNYGSLCVAIGNHPLAGGYLYAGGTFASRTLAAHRIGARMLDEAHRLRVTLSLPGKTYRWLAPFEALAGSPRSGGGHGRFTGFAERPDGEYAGARPSKDFRGWVWQGAECLNTTNDVDGCEKKSWFSLRLPAPVRQEPGARHGKTAWPPPDLDQIRVRVEVLAPGDGPPLFDTDQEGAVPPFSLNDLSTLLLPGETLTIRRIDSGGETVLIHLTGEDEAVKLSSPLLTRLIRKLPVKRYDAPVEIADEVATPLGSYRILLTGDARSVSKTLSAVAARVSWFVEAMLLAIGLAWLVIELGIIRRIGLLTQRSQELSQTVKVSQIRVARRIARFTRHSNGLSLVVRAFGRKGIAYRMARLTRRSRQASKTVAAAGALQHFDLSDLRGSDELGILANGMNDLLQRLKEDAELERIRAEQEKDLWHAIGHEIMSPLHSLQALHGRADDPSYRNIQRMQQAVRVLYGSASPSEAFESTAFQVQAIDLAEFLPNVAEHAGIADVRCALVDGPVPVHADEYPLEDVFSHVLKNADRYRRPGTPITLALEIAERTATVTIHNVGAPIPEALIDKIFEYGVSEQPETGAQGNRGQGLFVARTYMAKMGGTISARNVEDGVSFLLTLQRVRSGQAG